MSTPNPLIPQGSLQSQGTSNVRVAVATIVAIHLVFFGGLLLQGCKRETKLADGTGTAAATNNSTAALSYPPIDSNSLYYSNSSTLPAETSTAQSGVTGQSNLYTDPARSTANPAQPQPDPWRNANLSQPIAPAEPTTAAKEYTVVARDTFAKIAKAQGTTVAALKKANPGVEPEKIRPGQKIMVPAGAPASAESSKAEGSKTSAAKTATGGASEGGNSYTVKPGDTLTKIAREHGVTVGQIRAANNLKVSRVNAGQKLKIPAAGANAKPTAAAATNSSSF